MKRSIMTRLVALAGAALFAVSGCQLDGWKLAFGPLINGETAYGGVELEFSNGVDFVVPIVPLGDNFDGGWLGH